MDQTVPHYVFFWIPNASNNTASGNELFARLEQYSSAIDLVRKDSRVTSRFCVVQSLAELVDSLNPIPGCLPVFVLIGHGDS
jgi:hypothetical protein